MGRGQCTFGSGFQFGFYTDTVSTPPYVNIARDVSNAQHSKLVGWVALDGLQLLSGHETREAAVPVGTVDDHRRVRGDVLVEGRGEEPRVGVVLLFGGEDILGLVANMILNVNLGSVDTVKAGICRAKRIRKEPGQCSVAQYR